MIKNIKEVGNKYTISIQIYKRENKSVIEYYSGEENADKKVWVSIKMWYNIDGGKIWIMI